MSRVHDMGGQTGFGPVPVGEDDGPPFAADWEARVYALATMLRRRGVFNTDELRDAIERLPPEDYLAASYYERWLGAIEMLVTEKGPEMAEDRELPAGQHGPGADRGPGPPHAGAAVRARAHRGDHRGPRPLAGARRQRPRHRPAAGGDVLRGPFSSRRPVGER